MLLRLRNIRRRISQHPRRRMYGFTFGAVFLLVGIAACDSTNTYPIDFYSEMHYQKSYRTVEPPRFGSPDTLVPVDGRMPEYGQQDMVNLENPFDADQASVDLGQAQYAENCVMCHGEGGEGNGSFAGYLQQVVDRPPADLTQERLRDQPDGYLYSVIHYGLGQYMPAFGNLIDGDEAWHLVNYIRALQEGGSASQ